MSLRFEPLPDDTNSRSHTDWVAITDELRAHPNAWAVVKVCKTKKSAQGAASSIRCGAQQAFGPAGVFEAKYRLINDEHRVYARYIGEATK